LDREKEDELLRSFFFLMVNCRFRIPMANHSFLEILQFPYNCNSLCKLLTFATVYRLFLFPLENIKLTTQPWNAIVRLEDPSQMR